MGDDSKGLRELADQLRATSERLRKESDDLNRQARELEDAINLNQKNSQKVLKALALKQAGSQKAHRQAVAALDFGCEFQVCIPGKT